MKEINEAYLHKIYQLIKTQDADNLKKELAEWHPADIAEIVADLNVEETEYLLRQLDDETAAAVLIELDDDQRHDVLEDMPNELIAKRLEKMDANDAVDVIQELDEDDRNDVIKRIDDVEQAGDIVDLLQYGEDTAGGHMSTEMVVVNGNMSMPDCIKAMREQAEDLDEIYNVYVVDDDNRLKGIFPLKTTITNPSASKIKHVMIPDPISVQVDTPIDEVAIDFDKYDLVAIPVVDSIGRLVGRITVDDIMDEVREAREHDYQLASGITGDIEPSDNVLEQTRARLPWLLLGVAGGIVCSLLLGGSNLTLLQVLPGLVMFIPLLGGTGGNVGTQSSAVMVQGLANGSIDLKDTGKILLKELGVALLNAIIIAGLVYGYLYINPAGGDPARSQCIAMAVSLSLLCVVVFASVFGTIVPLVLERIGVNPATATGPFISITNDIVALLFYLGISSWLITALA